MKQKQLLLGGIALIMIAMVLFFIILSRSPLKNITYKDYQTKFQEKQTFILYLGSKSCTHCQDFKPTLEKITRKYQLKVYYLDVSTLSSEEYEIVKTKTFLKGTPTIVFVEDGVVQTNPRIEGDMSYSEALKLFKESKFMK